MWLATHYSPDPNPIGAASIVAAVFGALVLWCLLRGGGRRKRALILGPPLMLAGTVWTQSDAGRFPDAHHIVGTVIFTAVGLAASLENLREHAGRLLANGAAFSALHGAVLTVYAMQAGLALRNHPGDDSWMIGWGLAAWVIAWLTLVILAARRVGERRRRWKGGKCLACGYDLRASGVRCSKCGTSAY